MLVMAMVKYQIIFEFDMVKIFVLRGTAPKKKKQAGTLNTNEII